MKDILDSADKRILLIKREVERHDMSSGVYSKIQEKIQTQKMKIPETEPEQTVSVAEVMELSHKGISTELIARKLDISAGEVELMISLQDRRGKE